MFVVVGTPEKKTTSEKMRVAGTMWLATDNKAITLHSTRNAASALRFHFIAIYVFCGVIGDK